MAAANASTDRPLPDSVLNPRHPDRICWGCDRYCPANYLACGGGTIRTPHPKEMFGDDWTADEEAVGAPATVVSSGS